MSITDSEEISESKTYVQFYPYYLYYQKGIMKK